MLRMMVGGIEIMGQIGRFFRTLLAVVFLIEAWLWRHTERLVATVVRIIPLESMKQGLATTVSRLPPFAVLFIFLIPVAVLLPFKLAALRFLARGQIILGIVTFVLAKLVGVAVAAFVLETCKPKLMQMRWFAVSYEWTAGVWRWAHRLVDPVKLRIRAWLQSWRTEAGGFGRRTNRLRRSGKGTGGQPGV